MSCLQRRDEPSTVTKNYSNKFIADRGDVNANAADLANRRGPGSGVSYKNPLRRDVHPLACPLSLPRLHSHVSHLVSLRHSDKVFDMLEDSDLRSTPDLGKDSRHDRGTRKRTKWALEEHV